MPKGISGGTGKASIDKQGHTATGSFGDDPNLSDRGKRTPRDLGVKATRSNG